MPWRLADVCPEDDVQCLVGRGCKSGAPPVEAARQWSKRPRGNECDNNCHLVVKCRKCCLDVILPAEAERGPWTLLWGSILHLEHGVSTLQFSSGHLQLLLLLLRWPYSPATHSMQTAPGKICPPSSPLLLQNLARSICEPEDNYGPCHLLATICGFLE